ncbi:lysophospholipid acyltransferase family protein [Armatimonas sp.]|uniref:lysophospholipid acyltransferase family protein n=1 Tax=Armatimonas sp. TaxID=1872638 RepID=UPI00286BCF75|nr:lysophospholipid acyltransferase family protein [Armatimonas sp.]
MRYRLLRTLCRWLAHLLFIFHGGLRVTGNALVPQKGGVLICPNHVCDADPPAIGAALDREAWFMAKSELFSIPVLRWLLPAVHAFPIRRDSADRAALSRAEELLKAGEAVVIFPEGGGNAEGTLQPLHPGALLLALRTKVPVVPVALFHTNKVVPYGATRPQKSPEPVRVEFGEPLDFSDLYGKKGAVDEATKRLTERLAQMLGQPIPEGKPQKHD